MFEDRMVAYYLKILENKKSFSRADLMDAMNKKGKAISEASFKLELQNIYEEAFAKYAIDESCMFRYAKRRGAEKKIREFIKESTNVQLRVG